MFKESNTQSVSSAFESDTASSFEEPKSGKSTAEVVDEALKVTMPTWPLQNAVAVNPFWNFRGSPFKDTVSSLESPIGCTLMLPLKDYLTKVRSQDISLEVLKKMLHREQIDEGNTQKFLKRVQSLSSVDRINKLSTFVEFSGGTKTFELVHADLCKHLMAYFDQRQALVDAPDSEHSFWEYWASAQQFDRSMRSLGFSEFRDVVKRLQNLTPRAVIEHALREVGFRKSEDQVLYLQTLLGNVLGWASQFAYHTWQRGLGYQGRDYGSNEDLLAVCLAYELGAMERDQLILRDFVAKYSAAENLQTLSINKARYLLQVAWEKTVQTKTALKINTQPTQNDPAWCKMVFCIDVRSEMIRRSIEKNTSGVETKGFAGFFGMPLDLKMPHKRSVSHHLPVLLPPNYQAQVSVENRGSDARAVRSFVKHVRKLPYSSFFYVEVFGLLSAWQLVRDSLTKFANRLSLRNTVDERIVDQHIEIKSPSGEDLEKGDLVGRCAAILKHLGMTSNFPELVVFVGHTSKTTNNAFQSSLTCGACGGHGGELNARVLADLLNNSKIRKALVNEGITIPGATYFLAGLHETVTDQVMFFPSDDVQDSLSSKIKSLEKDLAAASKETAQEREWARTHTPALTSETLRAHNWSEVRPEWGLAGNHSFIVAPRWRTENQNLSARAFLHDYDWKQDESFATLELIMTAPMVVTNWINMQYYASVVGHSKFSSGSKTLHNIFGESAVLQGNGGDLKIGLPIESIHDGTEFVHDPLRLTVYIEAPQDAIESIIAKHEVVRDLIDNEWLTLVRIDSESGQSLRRVGTKTYEAILGD